MHIGQKVRIRKLDYNDHLPEYECLSVGSEGRIVDQFQHTFRWDEMHWIVKMADGKRYPMFEFELEGVG